VFGFDVWALDEPARLATTTSEAIPNFQAFME
jgi:hypothetical protein